MLNIRSIINSVSAIFNAESDSSSSETNNEVSEINKEVNEAEAHNQAKINSVGVPKDDKRKVEEDDASDVLPCSLFEPPNDMKGDSNNDVGDEDAHNHSTASDDHTFYHKQLEDDPEISFKIFSSPAVEDKKRESTADYDTGMMEEDNDNGEFRPLESSILKYNDESESEKHSSDGEQRNRKRKPENGDSLDATPRRKRRKCDKDKEMVDCFEWV